MNLFKRIATTLAFVCSLALSTQVLAVPFSNGDFSSGLSGWQGSLSGVTVDPSTSPQFSVTGSQAQISSDFSEFPVTLFQEFTLGAQSSISFNYSWMPTGGADIFNAILMLTGGSNTEIDLIDTNSSADPGKVLADISAFSGQAVRLYFTVLDFDYFTEPDNFTSDILRIGNIQLNGSDSTPVPEPSTMLLLGVGLAGLALYRKRNKV